CGLQAGREGHPLHARGRRPLLAGPGHLPRPARSQHDGPVGQRGHVEVFPILRASVALPVGIVVAAYLVGSISFGLIVARAKGIDLRAIGSGNIGATNVKRALGARAGFLVLVLDAAKGLVPVAAARFVDDGSTRWVAAAAVSAVLGHVLPIWHGLRGGKG